MVKEKIKVLIVEDNPSSMISLKELLIQNFSEQIDVIYTADSVNKAYDIIINYEPILVFLDIEIKQGTGFDLLMKFKHINFYVIFTTNYDKYALKAIKFSCIDYILKPVTQNELEEAYQKFIDNYFNSHNYHKTRSYNESPQNLNYKIGIPSYEGYLFVSIKKIILIEADKNYSKFYFVDRGAFLSSYSLSHYEEKLKELGFIRISKSYIVNLEHIEEYIKKDGGSVVMSNQMVIAVSDLKKDYIKKLFKL